MKTEPDSKETHAAAPDRRRNPRYWLTAALTIRSVDGSAMSGLTVEISEGGMSAMASNPLKVGDMVELDPVVGGKVLAVVRHKLGQMYGFEFVDLSAEQARRIAESCKKFGVYRRGARA